MRGRHETGFALFTAIFLIVVLAVVATAVAVISTTQQVTSGRSLDATRAYYAARARLDREIANAVGTTPGAGDCASTNAGIQQTIRGFTTDLEDCSAVSVSEGGTDYEVFTLTTAAFRGNRNAGTLVRRELQAVVTNRD